MLRNVSGCHGVVKQLKLHTKKESKYIKSYIPNTCSEIRHLQLQRSYLRFLLSTYQKFPNVRVYSIWVVLLHKMVSSLNSPHL